MTDTSDHFAALADRDSAAQTRTFLIADVRGYTRFTQERGDEAAARLTSIFADIARAVVEERDGRLIELRGDEALAVFDSTRQALRAGVDLQVRLAQHSLENTDLPIPAGIGIDAGEAIAVGGGFRGGALNLAARLCSLAGPGEVLVSEAVTHLARKVEGLDYVERGMMQIKGFAEPVRVVGVVPEGEIPEWETGSGQTEPDGLPKQDLPIGNFLGALPSAPLVGREDELERIFGAVDRVADGTGQFLALAGGAGFGKTRLAQEATLVVRNRGFAVLTGRCYKPQRSVSYHAFVEALTTAYAAAPPGIRASAARRWPHLGRLLPEHILASPTPGSEPQEEKLRLFRAVTGFLAAIAEIRPAALFLDDLHWADEASIELLQFLARNLRASRVLLLATYRDTEVDRQHPLDGALRDLSREGLLDRVAVRRLTQEETTAMVASTIGDMAASEEFAEYVHRRTKGNPFFIDEMLRALGGRYHLVREIGAGGMGRVFEALDTRTGKTVAAKIMFASSEANFDALLRFQQEGAVLATLKHRNIVEVYSTFTEEHASCIVMEMLDGRSLGDILRSETPDLAQIRSIARQAAAALAHAHSKSIVHRDVKPDNIIVGDDGLVKVTDFGIARILRPDATVNTMQSTGMSLGTPLYMAPEQVEGKKLDGRTDIYSLGAVMYQMVSGRPPFEGTDPVTIAYKHVHEAPAPPSELAADVPADWEEVILKALAKSPADRFQSAAEMEGAIEGLSTEPRAASERTEAGSLTPTQVHRPEEETPQSRWTKEPPSVEDAPRSALVPTAEGSGDELSATIQGRVAERLGRRQGHSVGTAGWGLSRQGRKPVRPGAAAVSLPRLVRVIRPPAVIAGLGIVIAAAVALVFVVLRSGSSTSHAYVFGKPDLAYGLPLPSPSPIGFAGGVAADGQGNVYVADNQNGTIHKLSPYGDPLAVWPAPGSGFTLNSPTSVSLDSHGNVYIADSLNNRVVKLTPTGQLAAKWSARPGGNTQAGNTPAVSALTADRSGTVYTFNAAALRIEKYASTGRFLGQWPVDLVPTSTGANINASLSTSADGDVWFVSASSHRIERFSPAGKLRASSGLSTQNFRVLSQIAADRRGDIFVADVDASTSAGRVQEFSQQGKLLSTWGNVSAAPSLLRTPAGLAVDTPGHLYVSDPGNGVVRKFGPASGPLLASWNGARRPGTSKSIHPLGMTVDAQGHVSVSDPTLGKIMQLSPDGRPQSSWGSQGGGRGQMSSPWNLAADAHGTIYVADLGNNRIDVFSSSGAFLRSVGSHGSGPGQLNGPSGVAVDGAGDMFVVDAGNSRIVRLSPAGKQLATWSYPSSFAGSGADAVALGPDGNVFMTVSFTGAIFKLSPDLKPLARWGSTGLQPGQLSRPSGIAADAGGNIFVVDSGNNRIQVFSADGKFLARLGSLGSKPGQFKDPNSVTIDRQGNVYVTDTGNNRIQKFFAGT